MKSTLACLFTVLISLATACASMSSTLNEKLKADGRFATLLDVLNLSQLDIESNEEFTFFAPTDDAFSKLDPSVLDNLLKDPAALRDILLFHVTDKKLKENRLKKLIGATTLSNEWLPIEDIQFNQTDMKVKNGVIHMIDNVLIPRGIAADPSTREIVDIERYMGLWYEIGRYENSFQKKCGETTALYELRDDGKVRVTNTCKLLKNNELNIAKAIASIKDTQTNSVLAVSFVPFFNRFGLFAGDYRILELGADYEWVMVGDKTRKYFWILARTPTLDEALYQDLLSKSEELGYDRTKVRRSPTWQN